MSLETFRRLVARLRSANCYEHPVDEVAVIETHISAVLLAGERVYKLKKPVNFGFADFSTLDKRRHNCEEELRLNRRFTPELYLDVVAVRGSRAAPRLFGDGPVLDYAVRMRRFEQADLLERRIGEPGAVSAPMMEAFAADVARVHDQAAQAVAHDGFASAARIQQDVEECWPPLHEIGMAVEDARLQALAAGMRAQGQALAAVFGARLDGGRVRECHGDLHLGNLFLADGVVRAFDCIEFNPALRWIDVASDIAFTTMDLHYHGEAALARRCRNAYLDATADYGMLRVLSYYEVYRALVRAKVAALRERTAPGTGRERARGHLDLARRLWQRRVTPVLIITCGLSGSGKTVYSSELVACSEAVRVRSDIERQRWPDSAAGRYSRAGIDGIYARLAAQAAAILDAGYPVIVDATFIRHAHRERFRQLAAGRAVPFRILHCSAPQAVLRTRIGRRTARGGDASEADLAVLDQQLGVWQPPTAEEAPDTVRYDTGSPPLTGSVLAALGLTPG